MSDRNVLQADVYIDGRTDEEVAEALARSLGAAVQGGTIVTPILDLDVLANNRAKSAAATDDEDAFLGFPTIIEVFTAEAGADEQVIDAVAGVLAALDDLGLRYVTAADFEDDLPRQGRSAG